MTKVVVITMTIPDDGDSYSYDLATELSLRFRGSDPTVWNSVEDFLLDQADARKTKYSTERHAATFALRFAAARTALALRCRNTKSRTN